VASATHERPQRERDRRADAGTAAAAGRVLPTIAGGRIATLPVALTFWDATTLPAADAGAPEVRVRHPTAISHLLHEPSQLGLARAWARGSIDVDGDLESVLALRGRFRDVTLSAADRGRLALAAVRVAGAGVLRRPSMPAAEARPRGRRHSLARDRASVRHHYDVSNDFYELLLGPSMVYSCAYFAEPGEPLEAAQERKLDVICRKLRLQPGERLLDVGCGWGSLLLHAAARHGVRGVGVTLSEAQARYARERVRRAGLADRVEVRVADYREIADGPFDKIASVGMYEHVGRGELDRYVASVRSLLRPGGLFLNHGIARLHSEPPAGDTFISRYVFPDGELHPVTDVMSAMQEAELEVRDVESLREHYPLTLRRWAANLDARRAEAIAEIGEERERVWRLYLAGCALAFEEGDITVYQVLAARSGAPHRLPLARRAPLADARAHGPDRRHAGAAAAATPPAPHRGAHAAAPRDRR
jgi:cyclopropane-fatty-acyl-phospholipid synthase